MKNTQKTAILTGASSGIGQAAAKLLSRSGYKVYGLSRRKLVDPGAVIGLQVDITNAASIESAVADVLKKEGRIDLLVNNAGLWLLGAAEECSISQARALFETNFFGLLQVTQAVLPAMRKQRSGRIINISSVLGFLPAPYSALYSASKHAIEGYTETLDHEIRTLGIRALLVEPAFTRTEIASPAPDKPIDDYAEARGNFSRLSEKAIAGGDLPETVAETILRAATDDAPKLRYPAGSTAKRLSILRRFVPNRAFDRSLRKQFGLVPA